MPSFTITSCQTLIALIDICNLILQLALQIKAAAIPHISVQKSYHGYKLLHIFPNTTEKLQVLHNLFTNDTQLRLDFWKVPGKPGRGTDVMVPPASYTNFTDILNSNLIDYKVKLDNVEDAIKKEREAAKFSSSFMRDSSSGNSGFFEISQYHSYKEIQEWLQRLQSVYPDRVRVASIGYSMEGRSMDVIRIGGNKAGKPAFYIDGGMHAREWIAPAVAIYIINELTNKYDSNPKIKQFVDEIDWYILPVANPDGYEYSRNTDRMWRKNRNPNPGPDGNPQSVDACWGVDLNRNFDIQFASSGSSWNPCSEIYNGIQSFSEPEARNIRDFVSSHRSLLDAFITLHSYAQIWMFPYSYAVNTYADDWRDLKQVGDEAAQDLRQLYGTSYVVDTGANSLYASSGGSDDWSKARMNIKYVYLIELRPDDNSANSVYGFLLPESQIIPTGLETWTGLQEVANAILKRNNIMPFGEQTQPVATTSTPVAVTSSTTKTSKQTSSKLATSTRSATKLKPSTTSKLLSTKRTTTSPSTVLKTTTTTSVTKTTTSTKPATTTTPTTPVMTATQTTPVTTTTPTTPVTTTTPTTPVTTTKPTTPVTTTTQTTTSTLAPRIRSSTNKCDDDSRETCDEWIRNQPNICRNLPNYMRLHCAKSCGYCDKNIKMM